MAKIFGNFSKLFGNHRYCDIIIMTDKVNLKKEGMGI